jgi:hypothetical protein
VTVTVTRSITPAQFNVITVVSYNGARRLDTAGTLADCPAADMTHVFTPEADQATVDISPGATVAGVAVNARITTADCAGT